MHFHIIDRTIGYIILDLLILGEYASIKRLNLSILINLGIVNLLFLNRCFVFFIKWYNRSFSLWGDRRFISVLSLALIIILLANVCWFSYSWLMYLLVIIRHAILAFLGFLRSLCNYFVVVLLRALNCLVWFSTHWLIGCNPFIYA